MGWRFYAVSAGNPRMVSAQGTRAHRLERETTRMRVRLIWERVESSGVSGSPAFLSFMEILDCSSPR